MNIWNNTEDIETILNDVRENSIYLSNFHKKNYFYYKKIETYFRLPTIVFSSISSVASVGLTAYLSQPHISAITCLISLSVGIINSIELYMKITDTIEAELETSKLYYNLSIDLHKLLNLDQSNRTGEPRQLLDAFFMRYIDLVEKSNLLHQSYPDKLNKLPKQRSMFSKIKSHKSISSNNSENSSLSSNPISDDIERVI
jgi:hypothetical protein